MCCHVTGVCYHVTRCMEARWRDIYDREQLTFEVENRKKVVIATPVSNIITITYVYRIEN